MKGVYFKYMTESEIDKQRSSLCIMKLRLLYSKKGYTTECSLIDEWMEEVFQTIPLLYYIFIHTKEICLHNPIQRHALRCVKTSIIIISIINTMRLEEALQAR